MTKSPRSVEVLWKLFRRLGRTRFAWPICRGHGWLSSLVVLVVIFEAQTEIDMVVRLTVIAAVGVCIGRPVHRRRR